MRVVRQELVQRRIEQADRHRVPVHCLEDSAEVVALHRQQLLESALPALQVRRHDHLAHGLEPVSLEEHVLRPAQPDPFRTELARAAGVVRRIGVGTYTQHAKGVGPGHELRELCAWCGLHEHRPPKDHTPRAPIDGNPVAFPHGSTVDVERAGGFVHIEVLRAGYTTFPHAARHHRCVTRHAAARRENGAGRGHPVEIIRAGLTPHQDYPLTAAAPFRRRIGVEHRPASRCTRRSREAGREHRDLLVRIDRRMQNLVELARIDPQHSLLLGDHSLTDHLHGRVHRSVAAAFGGACLEHVQLAGFHREFDVLHVTEVPLESLRDLLQLPVGRW